MNYTLDGDDVTLSVVAGWSNNAPVGMEDASVYGIVGDGESAAAGIAD